MGETVSVTVRNLPPKKQTYLKSPAIRLAAFLLWRHVMQDTRHGATEPQDNLLNAEEVATLLSVPVPTVRWWRQQNRLPKAIKLGRNVRWRREDILRWAESGME